MGSTSESCTSISPGTIFILIPFKPLLKAGLNFSSVPLIGQLQVGEVAGGNGDGVVSGISISGTESTTAAQGGCTGDRRLPGKRPPFTPHCIPAVNSTVAGCGRHGGCPPPPMPAVVAAWAVAHGWFIEAGRQRGAGSPGRREAPWH